MDQIAGRHRPDPEVISAESEHIRRGIPVGMRSTAV